MSDLPATFKRIDEMNSRIAGLEMSINNIQFRLLHAEQEQKATSERLEILMNQLMAGMEAIKIQLAEEKGAKAATKTNVNYTIELIKLIPIIAAGIALYLHK